MVSTTSSSSSKSGVLGGRKTSRFPYLGVMALLFLARPLSHVDAHMIMNTPTPYGTSTLDNSPLKNVAIGSEGSDFPCKQRTGVYDITTMNNMAVGAPQTLSFKGSASHSGGSCQLSVSLDKEPTAKSTFKVIQSYVGGCPTTTGDNGGSNSFNFSMPQGMPNGVATLAWTWFNKAGNREIYMNCAPITVTGGASDNTMYNSLPDMFVINLPNTGATGCASEDNKDVVFPDPGKFVTTIASTALGTFSGAGCPAPTGGSGAESATSAAPSSAAAVSSSVPGMTASPSAYQPSASSSGGLPAGFSAPGSAQSSNAAGSTTYTTALSTVTVSPVPASSIAPAPAQSSKAAGGVRTTYVTALVTVTVTPSPAGATSSVVMSTPAAAPAAPSSAPSAAPQAPVSSSNSKTPCATDGALVCNGASQFGLCDHGFVVWQPVAAGTSCMNGGIVKKRGLRLRAHGRLGACHGEVGGSYAAAARSSAAGH
ncbi:hypothetical protein B0A49_05896 [Cryomyces minteri]|uniref:Carbohydrate-binding module family 19 domain-containing protein n=1 Tax=Cryomyces minteri TaxID=331657 RepID=A0A4U0WYL8_9PEZI|nr:hypothetical protein B0A49_05896 [Cryomyces minteri]